MEKDISKLDMLEKEDFTVRDYEKAIIKKYRKPLWARFVRAVREFNLIEPGDKIAVAISGGKDSLLLAKLMQELCRHKIIDFELEFISMDPGFNAPNRMMLEENCKKMGIPLKIKESNVFRVAEHMGGEKPCYMCARMRRGFLYQFAEELGCNKLALGHHFDDVIETSLINLFYASEFKTMLPKLHSTNFTGLELIRPLYFVKEQDIIRYFKYIGIQTMQCGCAVTKRETGSKRKEIKQLIATLKQVNPNIDYSIFEAANNVNVDQVLGYRMNGEKHSFLEKFEADDLKLHEEVDE